MKKRLIALILCALILTSCQRITTTPLESSLRLPPVSSNLIAPNNDDGFLYESLVPLYLPSRDKQRLLVEYTDVTLSRADNPAERILRALLAFRDSADTLMVGQGTRLALYGDDPVEISGGVCTINLSSSMLLMENADLYTACLAMAATLCEIKDIHYVNILSADRAIGLDIKGLLPLGSVTAYPGTELPVLWEQMEARRAPVGENPGQTPLSAVATLYFPLADEKGVVAETRNLSFAGQNLQQQVLGLMSALSAGSQYLSGTCDMPDLSSMMILAPEVTDMADGGRMVTLHFSSSFLDTLQERGVDASSLSAAITLTLTTFIPGVRAVAFYAGNTPLHLMVGVEETGQHTRRLAAQYLRAQTTLYYPGATQLLPCLRATECDTMQDPRTLLTMLLRPPTGAEMERGATPLFQETLGAVDIIGLSIEQDVMLVNLSHRVEQAITDLPKEREMAVCYAMVNTLCEMSGLRRVVFFFENETLDTLAGHITWSGEFLYNPGMIERSVG